MVYDDLQVIHVSTKIALVRPKSSLNAETRSPCLVLAKGRIKPASECKCYASLTRDVVYLV